VLELVGLPGATDVEDGGDACGVEDEQPPARTTKSKQASLCTACDCSMARLTSPKSGCG